MRNWIAHAAFRLYIAVVYRLHTSVSEAYTDIDQEVEWMSGILGTS